MDLRVIDIFVLFLVFDSISIGDSIEVSSLGVRWRLSNNGVPLESRRWIARVEDRGVAGPRTSTGFDQKDIGILVDILGTPGERSDKTDGVDGWIGQFWREQDLGGLVVVVGTFARTASEGGAIGAVRTRGMDDNDGWISATCVEGKAWARVATDRDDDDLGSCVVQVFIVGVRDRGGCYDSDRSEDGNESGEDGLELHGFYTRRRGRGLVVESSFCETVR